LQNTSTPISEETQRDRMFLQKPKVSVPVVINHNIGKVIKAPSLEQKAAHGKQRPGCDPSVRLLYICVAMDVNKFV